MHEASRPWGNPGSQSDRWLGFFPSFYDPRLPILCSICRESATPWTVVTDKQFQMWPSAAVKNKPRMQLLPPTPCPVCASTGRSETWKQAQGRGHCSSLQLRVSSCACPRARRSCRWLILTTLAVVKKFFFPGFLFFFFLDLMVSEAFFPLLGPGGGSPQTSWCGLHRHFARVSNPNPAGVLDRQIEG